MARTFYGVTVPSDLVCYYHVMDMAKNVEDATLGAEIDSQVVIKRNKNGCLDSVAYYTPDKELSKEIFYSGDSIFKINYYRKNVVSCIENYNDGLLMSKYFYSSSGCLSCSFEYKYNKKRKVESISKNRINLKVAAVYNYDDFDRIIKREVYKNSEKVMEQNYKYDILDRIVEYRDENQRIVVKKISKKNELISYVITDRMGNEIVIENFFSTSGYEHSTISLNGHSSQVKDTSYVDNIMLKKPYTNEDDLDMIIANLLNNYEVKSTKRNSDSEINSMDMIDSNIRLRTLPISMRKRLLLQQQLI